MVVPSRIHPVIGSGGLYAFRFRRMKGDVGSMDRILKLFIDYMGPTLRRVEKLGPRKLKMSRDNRHYCHCEGLDNGMFDGLSEILRRWV